MTGDRKQSVPTNTDVLIAGAGPVGLFLANECARRGLRYRIVETRAGQSEHSKALAIMPRTMEIFEMAGIVEPFLKCANRVTEASVDSRQRHLATMRFAPAQTPYRFVAMVPQDVTERLLVEALRERSGSVEYASTLVALHDEGSHVRATLDFGGRRSELSASYVVGCDGAHSTVRHLLDLPFDGGEYDLTFLLADVETNGTRPANAMHLCPHEDGPLAIFPIGATRRRIVAMTREIAGAHAPSLALVCELLARRAPAGVEATQLHWSSFFRIHHRRTALMQRGRVFIAGDASHIHSPFGGQGMNTGLHDVWNLAWKLDLVARGIADEPLLQSYTLERRPIVKRVLEATDAMTRAASERSLPARALRAFALPIVSRFAVVQRAFVENLSQLGLRYQGSALVDGRGARVFDDIVRGGAFTNQFLLLLGHDANAQAAQEAHALALRYPRALQMRRLARAGLLLVRPDGYAALDTPRANARALARARAVLEANALRESDASAPLDGARQRNLVGIVEIAADR